MKNNMPVTQHEYSLNDNAILMSTTDTQSHITYANSAFITASGFEEGQLTGQPHNIIRHPDMPWQPLPICGIPCSRVTAGQVLSRTAAVTATITGCGQMSPVWHDKKLTGYISVRTVPTRDEIKKAPHFTAG